MKKAEIVYRDLMGDNNVGEDFKVAEHSLRV